MQMSNSEFYIEGLDFWKVTAFETKNEVTHGGMVICIVREAHTNCSAIHTTDHEVDVVLDYSELHTLDVVYDLNV